MLIRVVALALLACSFVIASGCGGGTEKATITGTVTVDGKLVEKGTIMFTVAQGSGEPITVNITNGKYEATTTPGPKRVHFSVPVVIGQQKEYPTPDAKMVDITKESLGPKFNTQTEYTFDVQPGANQKDWPLVLKPGK